MDGLTTRLRDERVQKGIYSILDNHHEAEDRNGSTERHACDVCLQVFVHVRRKVGRKDAPERELREAGRGKRVLYFSFHVSNNCRSGGRPDLSTSTGRKEGRKEGRKGGLGRLNFCSVRRAVAPVIQRLGRQMSWIAVLYSLRKVQICQKKVEG